MKTTPYFHGFYSSNAAPLPRFIFHGASIALLALLCGCATPKPGGVTTSADAARMAPLQLEPGLIVVTCPQDPGRISFDRAEGRIRYASDGAASVARTFLDPPFPPNPGLDALFSPLGLVLAPFGAAYGAVAAGQDKLTESQLSAAEAGLAAIMTAMADQKALRDPIVASASEIARRRLVAADSAELSFPDLIPVSAMLETRIEELRLEREGSSDTSFALRIKGRVRLCRMSDARVLFDLPLEYKSGKALFVDWSCPAGLQGVAETGYLELANYVARHLLSSSPEGPILAGTGNKRSPTRSPAVPPAMLASFQSGESPGPVRVGYVEEDLSQLDIYSVSTFPGINLQKPLSKDEAVAEGIQDVVHALDGLQNSRNLVVQLSAYTAAIPMSLWKQTVGLIRGVPAETLKSADLELLEALQTTNPQREMAQQIAMQLTPQTPEPVLVVKNPMGEAGKPITGLGRAAASSPATRNAGTALVVHVRRAALTGNSGPNPPLALCVEAEATLFRVSDGVALYSCPINYRGESRKFTRWAAHGARPFRQELERCYMEIGNIVVKELVTRGLTVPGNAARPTVAKN